MVNVALIVHHTHCRKTVEIEVQGHIQSNLALLHKLHNGNGGNGFRHGHETVDGIFGNGETGGGVGKAEGVLIQNFVVTADQQSSAS